MSAAEPAQPQQPYMNTPQPAPVISLSHRRHNGGQPTGRGRRAAMHTTPPPAGTAGDQPADDAALRGFAGSIETSFLAIDQSLTDPRTAAAYQRTLDVWETALHGSHAQGVIDAHQLRELTEVLHGMRQAPRLI